MNDIVPSRGVDRAAPAPVARPGTASVVVNPPPAAAALTGTTVIDGEVEVLRGKGQAVLRTGVGPLLVAVPPGLEPGSRVTLQLRHAAGRLIATILRIDGQPPGQPPAAAASGASHGPSPGTAGAAASAAPGGPVADVVTLGQSLRAVVESPASGAPAGALDGTAPPAAGTRLRLQVVSLSQPGTPGAPSSTPAQPAPKPSLAARSGTPPPGTPPSGTSPPGTPPPGPAQLTALPASPGPAGGPGPAGAAPVARDLPPGARIFLATVGVPETGRGVLLSSPLGQLRLEQPLALPPGTRLTLALSPGALNPGAGQTRAAPAPLPAIPDLAQAWPALEEAWTLLHAKEQPFARGAAAELRLPQTGPRLASTLLFFLQALGAGDMAAWLGGQVTAALDRAGRGDLRARLAEDFAQLARLSDAGGEEWHFIPLPLHDGGAMRQIHLFLRRRRGGGGDGEERDVTRFVLDLSFSRLGEMQLDGLVRDRRFDLILRSRQPLAEAMRRDITEIFEEANAIVGGTGQIVFQASADWSPMPLAPGPGGESDLLA